MRILFLNPPFIDRFSRTARQSTVTRGDTLYYPMWLTYAAGAAEQAGHNVRLLDAPFDELHFQGQPKEGEILASLGDFIPDIVVLETGAYSIYNDIEVAKKVKVRYPHTFIVIAGICASALYEEILGLSEDIDAVAVGEYDYTIRDIAQALEGNIPLSNVDGLVFRREGELVKNKKRDGIKNLDALPFVSSVYRKHLNFKNYFSSVADYPVMMIITSRGCPFKCFFCVCPQIFHGHDYRARTPENVVEEFEYIVHNFPEIKEIGIEDDCFTVDKERVKEICEILIKRDIKIKWYCNARADLDYNLLKKMNDAGCRLVSVGFESGCQKILDNIQKDIKVEQYYQFMKATKRAGILVEGCFMIGNLGDARESVSQSYKFARKINCDSIRFYPLYLYPGTEAFNWAQKNNYINEDELSNWLREDSLLRCVLDNPDLPPKEMVYLRDYYEKRYYLRFRYLFMKLRQCIVNRSEGQRNLHTVKIFLYKFFRSLVHKSI